MENIVLEVDEALAKAWKNSSPSLRATYEDKINAVLRELQEAEFDVLLQKAGKLAGYNGLTQERLDELLKDDADNNSERYEWWNDEEMVAELERRADDLKSGKDPGFTLEESVVHLKARLKKNG